MVARVVQAARRLRGLTQKELAVAAGIARKTIGRIEAAEGASPQTRRALEHALDLDPGRLGRTGGEEVQDPRLLAFGAAVRVIRKYAGLSLKEAAADLGVSISELSRLERGLSAPRVLVTGGGREGAGYFIERMAWHLTYFVDHLDRLEDVLNGESSLIGGINRW